jgi:hypothetical protein
MTHDDSSLDLLERDLRSLAAAQPEDEQFRLTLRGQLAPTAAARTRRRPSWRFTVPAVAAVIAAAAVAIALVGVGGSDGPTAADAAILHRTLAAVTAPAHMILHVKTIDTQGGIQFVGEWWQQSSPPYASRGIKGSAGHLGEFADNGTTSYFYDPATRTIYERPNSGPATFNDPVSLIRQQLADGQAQLAGTTVIDGQSLYQIKLDGGITAYVDKTSYIPRYLAEPQRDGSTVRFQVVTYEYLPATSQNLQLLSITAQHADAHVDTNPNDWPAGVGK